MDTAHIHLKGAKDYIDNIKPLMRLHLMSPRPGVI